MQFALLGSLPALACCSSAALSAEDRFDPPSFPSAIFQCALQAAAAARRCTVCSSPVPTDGTTAGARRRHHGLYRQGRRDAEEDSPDMPDVEEELFTTVADCAESLFRLFRSFTPRSRASGKISTGSNLFIARFFSVGTTGVTGTGCCGKTVVALKRNSRKSTIKLIRVFILICPSGAGTRVYS